MQATRQEIPDLAVRIGAAGLALFVFAWLFGQMKADSWMNACAWNGVLLVIAAFGVASRRRWLQRAMGVLFVSFGLLLPFAIATFHLY